MDLVLRQLNETDEKAFLEGLQEWAGESLHWYSFIWKEGMSFAQLLEILRNEDAGIVEPGRVPHTMLYAFIEGKIIGRVSVRHYLNERLRMRGGHIGYAIAPQYRRQGYATEMMRQVLPFCKSLGLEKIMISCDDDNVPSWKIIEHFGGRLEDIVWDEPNQKEFRRYWIDL